MALKEINRYLTVAGCSVYLLDEKGLPESFPLGIDCEVTLPSVTHPTSDAQLMGSMSVPNQTAIEALECTISLPDSAAANKCRKKGVVGFMIRHAVSISQAESGEVTLGGFTATVKGLISGKEGLSIAPAGESSTNITIQCTYYRFVDDSDTEVINIDRPNGILNIMGEDYRKELRDLL